MSPFLFPLVLILYGECSSEKLTRHVARCLFYSYTFSILIFTVLSPTNLTIVTAYIPYCLVYVYLIFKVKIKVVKFIILLLLILQSINYLSLYLESYTLLLTLPFYFEYSNIILRELTIISIASCTFNFKTDYEIKVITVVLYLIEYSYIIWF